jgi:ketose-bisphosphate aldolase
MPIAPFAEMVDHAFSNGYAVPHFNVCNLEMVQAVAAAAEARRSPVIFGIHGSESAYGGAENLAGLIRTEIGDRKVLAAIHLDHGTSIDQVVQSIRAGYTSVMFDGSTIPLDDNVRMTEDVVRLAHSVDMSVEGEIGTIGRIAEYGEEIEHPHLADPAAAEDLAETGIDALAVAIGNVHGVYPSEPRLDFTLLSEIRRRTNIPLVLHGGSGIPVDQVQKAISLGIAKFNIGTNLHIAFTRATSDYLAEHPGSHDVTKMLGAARSAVQRAAEQGIDTAMSAGRF